MNIRKGTRRTLLALSLLWFLIIISLTSYYEIKGGYITDWEKLSLLIVIPIVSIWLIYLTIEWIVKGFKDDKKGGK